MPATLIAPQPRALNRTQLTAKVQHMLDERCRRQKFRLHVPAGGFKRDADLNIIVVTPENETVEIDGLAYSKILSAVEKELRSEGIKDVILVPVIDE